MIDSYQALDFALVTTHAGYQVLNLSSMNGEKRSDFSLPFSDIELENFILRMGHSRRGVRRIESPQIEAAQEFGTKLFQALFSGPLRTEFETAVRTSESHEIGLRIRLNLSNVPELADVPWEYLYDPAQARFIALSADTPLVRYLDLPQPARTLAVQPPLRVLIMISSPEGYPALDVNSEWKILNDSLAGLISKGLVSLTRLEKPTLPELQAQLRLEKYHIFHFIGHGRFSAQKEDGLLLLEDEQGKGKTVSGKYLGTLLHDEKSLRLAILNACEGASTSRSDPYAGVAQELVRQGIPAVIAMQYEVSERAALLLSREFYKSLADNYPVDAALGEARKAIYLDGLDIEWGIPVLYMRATDGKLFDVDAASAKPVESQPEPDPIHLPEESAPGGINVNIGGNVTGSPIVIGKDNTLINNMTRELAVNSNMEGLLASFAQLRGNLRNNLEAISLLDNLQRSLLEGNPDLTLIKEAIDWFNQNEPAFYTEVKKILSHPMVKQIMANSGEGSFLTYKQILSEN